MENLMVNVRNLAKLAILATIVTVVSPALNAQEMNSSVRAQIPFAFQVNSEVLPAGVYTVSKQSPHLLLVRPSSGGRGTFVLVHDTYSMNTPHKSTISFDRVGDKYFFRKVAVENSSDGTECPKSKAELLAEREVAVTASATTYVVASNTTSQR
jgi:hypothetical protein